MIAEQRCDLFPRGVRRGSAEFVDREGRGIHGGLRVGADRAGFGIVVLPRHQGTFQEMIPDDPWKI